MQVDVGVSRAASIGPEAVAATPLKIVVYLVPILVVGGLSMVLLIAAFTIFAANSTVLRDTALTIGGSARMAAAKTAGEKRAYNELRAAYDDLVEE